MPACSPITPSMCMRMRVCVCLRVMLLPCYYLVRAIAVVWLSCSPITTYTSPHHARLFIHHPQHVRVHVRVRAHVYACSPITPIMCVCMYMRMCVRKGVCVCLRMCMPVYLSPRTHLVLEFVCLPWSEVCSARVTSLLLLLLLNLL